MKLNRKWKQQRRHSMVRRGATAVEFALVLPLALLFIFGLIELFNLNFVHNTLKTAMIHGSREALIDTASKEDIEGEIHKVLGVYGVTNAKVTVDEIDPRTLQGEITIELDSAKSNSFLIKNFFQGKLKRSAVITRF